MSLMRIKSSLDQAYAKTVEILKAYPEIKGFFDCSVHGSAISQALKDKKRTDVKGSISGIAFNFSKLLKGRLYV